MAITTRTITATGVINLGDAADGLVGTYVLHISGGGTYSIVLRKKIRGGSVANGSAPTTNYVNFATGVGVAAGTAITAPTLVSVDCAACDLILDITYTSGVCTVEAEPVLG